MKGARRASPERGDALSRHRFRSLVDPLQDDPSFVSKPMFGCVAIYYRGLLTVLLADRADPWKGLIVLTEREHQESLLADVPALRVHPVLPKWLYVPYGSRGFAAASSEIIRRVADGDARIGVEPAPPRLPRLRRPGEKATPRRKSKAPRR